MTIKVQSPYIDDETRSKGVGNLIQDFIKDNWDVEGISLDDVKIGYDSSNILQSGKTITLKAYPYSSLEDKWEISGQRRLFRDAVQIDVYMQDNNLKYGNNDPRAVKILTFLRDLFIINQRDLQRGIFQVEKIFDNIEKDPIKKSITHIIFQIRLFYLWDMVNI
jgi:hypothetical protein